jgi:surface antigen
MRSEGHVACVEKIKNTYNISVEKSEGKGPVGRPRQKWS